jgi:hypothetical protein
MSGPMVDLEARWKRLGGHQVGCDCGLCECVRLDAATAYSATPPVADQVCCPTCPTCARFVRIGKGFAELWELGAPWPVRRWTCDAHGMDGCLTCKRKAEGDDR